MFGLSASAADGDILISVTPDGGTVAQTGEAGAGKEIDFFLAQTPGPSDLFSANFGVFDFAAGTLTDATGATTGAATGSGFLGDGNLLTSDIIGDSGDNSLLFNQEYANGAQPIPMDPNRALWLSVGLDTTGLADGIYAITLQSDSNGNFLDQTNNAIPSNRELFFQVGVDAVPEPGSLMLLGALSLVAATRRRRSIV